MLWAMAHSGENRPPPRIEPGLHGSASGPRQDLGARGHRASPRPAARRVKRWRWLALIASAVVLALVLFRQPLAERLWPEMRVQELLQQAEAALREGRLSAADGSGARQRFEAALALDSDRSGARTGLMRVAALALQRARRELAAGRIDEARRALALARELQVPRADADAVEAALRARESSGAEFQALLAQAKAKQAAGDGIGALPIYRRILAIQPSHTAALEGREDGLSTLLQQARQSIDRGDLIDSAKLIEQAQGYDPGHVDLPDAQARLARALEQRLAIADADLGKRSLEAAAAGYRQVLLAKPGHAGAAAGLDRLAAAYAQQASRRAADFDFVAAAKLLQQARTLAPHAAAVKEAELAVARAQLSKSRLASPISPQRKRERVQALLAAVARAESRGDWLSPPGDSAYDQLRAAQALAPEDQSVRLASSRFGQAIRACFESELSGNRLVRTRACYDAWQTVEPRDARLPEARRRLAAKWIAIGDERLGAGDIAFAAQALQEARQLDADAPGLGEFSARVRSAQPGGD